MSKSLGNFVTIHELLGGVARRPWPGEVIRLAMLATHYRAPIDFSEAKLDYWRNKLSHWVLQFKTFGSQEFDYQLHVGKGVIAPSKQVVEALSDDLNFQEVIVFLDALSRSATTEGSDVADELGGNLIWLGLMRNYMSMTYEMNPPFGSARPDQLSKHVDKINDARAIVLNYYYFSNDKTEREDSLQQVLGKIRSMYPQFEKEGLSVNVTEHGWVTLESLAPTTVSSDKEIEKLIATRNTARAAKDWKESDRIRDELDAMGVSIKDNKDGTTTWEVKR
jgi:cysteinyl-tRNA synthetase